MAVYTQTANLIQYARNKPFTIYRIFVEVPVCVEEIKGILFPKFGLMEGLRNTDTIPIAVGKIRRSDKSIFYS